MGVQTLLRSITGIAASISLAACGAAPAADRQSEGPTVVSLNPCIDAILVEVAEPDQVLALSHYSREPEASSIAPEIAAQFAVTGGTAEEVIALSPDLVLASSFIAPSTRSALERAGLRVETFGSPATVVESLAQVRSIASLTGRPDLGATLEQKIIATPQQPSGRGGWSALLWQSGQIVPGEQTLAAEHLRWAGFSSYAEEQGLAQADYVPLENVLAEPPQLLLIAGDEKGQRHPVISQSHKAMLIAEFDPKLLYCGGPTIPKARARLMEIRAEMEARP